jgi:hypothetical protein
MRAEEEAREQLSKYLRSIYVMFERTKTIDEEAVRSRNITNKRFGKTYKSMATGVIAALTFQYVIGDRGRIPSARFGSLRKFLDQDKNKEGIAKRFLNEKIYSSWEACAEKSEAVNMVLDYSIYNWYDNIVKKVNKWGVWNESQSDLTEETTKGVYYKHYKIVMLINPKIEKDRANAKTKKEEKH